MRWLVRGQAVAVVLLLALAGTVLGLHGLDQTSPVTVDDALERLRRYTPTTSAPPMAQRPTTTALASPTTAHGNTRDTGPGAAPPPPPAGSTTTSPAVRRVPPEGVYVYRTDGYEDVSALGGRRHDYPSETTITIRHIRCGVDRRWDALEERWDDSRECQQGNALVLRSYTTHHSFFGQSEDESFACDPGAFARPPVESPGWRWSFQCASTNSQTHATGVVVGHERVLVGGLAVDTLHTHVDIRLTGATTGTSPQDFWFAESDSTLTRTTGTIDADRALPVGRTHYHEHYDLVLESLTPRR